MPRLLGSPQSWNSSPQYETVHERRDRYRSPLNIRTPEVTEEQRKRWFGAPPSKVTIKRQGGTIDL